MLNGDTLSLVACVRNEERLISQMLQSVRGIADEIVLGANCCTDATVPIALRWGQETGIPVKIVDLPVCHGFVEAVKQEVLDAASCQWSLTLDGDEQLWRDAPERIQAALLSDPGASGWDLSRATVLTDQGDVHRLWYEYHTRLWRTGTAYQPQIGHTVAQMRDGHRRAKMRDREPHIFSIRTHWDQARRGISRGDTPPDALPPVWDAIPGWFDFQGIYDQMVDETPDGGTIVEVGTWLGKSTSYLGQRVQASGKQITVYGVDTFEGAPSDGSQQGYKDQKGVTTIFPDFIRNMDLAGVLPVVKPLPLYSHRAALLFPDQSLHAVYIDADHEFDAVVRDIQAWLPKVRTGGLLGGHDYSTAFPGVMSAVRSIFGDERLLPHASPGSWLVRVI